MNVKLSSRDLESVTLAIALVREQRERGMINDPGGESYARLSLAESVLLRIVKEAMMDSPIAKAYLDGSRRPQRHADLGDPLRCTCGLVCLSAEEWARHVAKAGE